MTDKQPEALRLAQDLMGIFISEEIHANKAQQIAALLRTQHKQIAAYKLLTESQEAQLSQHRAQADKFREAIATLQSEREANTILTAAIERKDALLMQSHEAMYEAQTYTGSASRSPSMTKDLQALCLAITKELQ